MDIYYKLGINGEILKRNFRDYAELSTYLDLPYTTIGNIRHGKYLRKYKNITITKHIDEKMFEPKVKLSDVLQIIKSETDTLEIVIKLSRLFE